MCSTHIFIRELKVKNSVLKTKFAQNFKFSRSQNFVSFRHQIMNAESFLKQRLVCVAVIDKADDAVPLAGALLAGGLNCIEVTFRTAAAAESIARIHQALPHAVVGAGTLLTPDQVKQAVDAGAQFGVSPGLSEAVSKAAHANNFPLFPGVITPTEIMAALELGWKYLKFFPAETFGGVKALKALIGPFGHTGVKFIPTGGITPATLPNYIAIPQVAAVGGSWMAERKLVADKDWSRITALTAEAMKAIAAAPVK
jgi:2-dehydro-3-deoxyphosphogluconate aldolase/(4S)-4-hydroxy-2-oxoglutarate aldolase